MRIGTVLFLLKIAKIRVRCSTVAQPVNEMMRVSYLLPRYTAQSFYAYTRPPLCLYFAYGQRWTSEYNDRFRSYWPR